MNGPEHRLLADERVLRLAFPFRGFAYGRDDFPCPPAEGDDVLRAASGREEHEARRRAPAWRQSAPRPTDPTDPPIQRPVWSRVAASDRSVMRPRKLNTVRISLDRGPRPMPPRR
jgi:hypothetical protein